MQEQQTNKPLRQPTKYFLIFFGWINVGIGFLGVVIPGLPTTPFLLLALWAFARSSQKFHDWLYSHPKFGPSLKAWRDHRVVSVKAKAFAVVTMSISLVYVTFFFAETMTLPMIMAAVMVPTALWLISRNSQVPKAEVISQEP